MAEGPERESQEQLLEDFSHGPGVKTASNARGCRFDPWLGTEIPGTTQGGQKTNKNRETRLLQPCQCSGFPRQGQHFPWAPH